MILTGIPGVGKTTLLLKIIAFLKLQDFRVGGMISREIRENGSRVGFEILNVESGKRSVLAGVKGDSGPRGLATIAPTLSGDPSYKNGTGPSTGSR